MAASDPQSHPPQSPPRASRHRPGRNAALVLAALQEAGRPLTAYDLLSQLGSQGLTAPPTVYRALSRLVAEGRVHRLESLNAFVACKGSHGGHGTVGFMICSACGRTQEFSAEGLDRQLDGAAAAQGFAVEMTVVELRGRCAACPGAESLEKE